MLQIHEYGHHFTLDQSQALNQDNNAIIVGGLSTRGGINESSYYSAKALKNYLYARTNLDFVRVSTRNWKWKYKEKWKFYKILI
ncbi:hypothetical protein NWQ34_01390 [Mycoplasmopsis felis]|uniref:hypothetical protein n=1 Tax=Mycoplasmopsis felis TaxID=33923 RepID=UPI0021DF753F|nr:hypothetical protein [Mycoplasmopsis felis]MCU9938350.1 hypothetical protein [Mycoplasmopsis felis]